jgi:hypothetical protein
MSDAFSNREKGFESKFQLDQEQQFRAAARRDRIFGQWAAGKLGYAGDAIATYAAEVVDSNFEKPGDDDMLGKVRADFKAKGVTVSDTDVSKALLDAYAAAAAQISAEKK